MSMEQFKARYLRYLDTFNQGDMDLMERMTDELFTVDAIFHLPGWSDVGSGSAY